MRLGKGSVLGTGKGPEAEPRSKVTRTLGAESISRERKGFKVGEGELGGRRDGGAAW